ncbi:MAG: sodium-dependent transporter [Chromatocurvus sp.]
MQSKHQFVEEARSEWSSEPAFIASMAAAAVGLGNLWRFPYMVGENGGGAFVIAYFLAIIVVALPIMTLEVAAGRLSKGGTVQTYRRVNRFGVVYGWFVVLVTMAITSYYVVVTGWTLGYAVDAVRGDLRGFASYTSGYNSLWYFLAVTLLAVLVLVRDIKAIEKLSKLMMPVLLATMIGLVIFASRTPGWQATVDFFFQVDWTRLADGRLWAFAFGQAFYSLTIGQGFLVTYGSFIPRKTHVPRACLVVAGVETSVALLAGWMIFPFVFAFGMEPAEGSQLAFATLPRAFEGLNGGYWIAIVFFLLFFLAAFSTCLAGMKVMIAAVAEEFRLSNAASVSLVTGVILLLGTASALSFTPLQWSIAGEPVLDVVDRITGGNVVIFSGVMGAALFCWFIPPHVIRTVLGTESRWWEWRMYLVGRYLPLLMLLWIVVTYAISQLETGKG